MGSTPTRATHKDPETGFFYACFLYFPYTNFLDWLDGNAELLEGFANPGEGFNVIIGHNHLSTTETGPFALLSVLENNDVVFVNSADTGFLRYSVYANELPEPDSFDEIAAIAEQEPGSLILVTCENESIDGGYLNRRIVFAKPIY